MRKEKTVKIVIPHNGLVELYRVDPVAFNSVFNERGEPTFLNIEDYDEMDIPDVSEKLDIENLIFNLTDLNEVQILLLRYLGFNYKESSRIMNLKNIGKYYSLWRKLREDSKKIMEE